MEGIQHSVHKVPTAAGELYAEQWQVATSTLSPIILLHDSLGSVQLWRDFPAQLAQMTQRQVIAYDRLGFGLSEAHPTQLQADFILTEAHKSFAAILDYFTVQNFIVLGHSVGAGMAVGCASYYLQRCDALILISGQIFNEERTIAGVKTAQQLFQQPNQLQRLEKYHGDKAVWVLNSWTGMWLSEKFKQWSLEQDAQTVQSPSLIIHGAEDEYGSVLHPQKFAQAFKAHSEVWIVENGKHFPHKEQPMEVLARIQKFLALQN